mgnify:CR=1 FL=1
MSVLDNNGQENIKNTDEQLDMTDKSIAGVSPDENAAADESTESSANVLDDSNLSDDFVIGKDFFIDSSEADSIAIEEDEREKKKVSVVENSKLLSDAKEGERDENVAYYLDKLEELRKKFAPFLEDGGEPDLFS